VFGRDKTLVPISALAVRICKYGRILRYDPRQPLEVIGSGLLQSTAAITLEDEANRLPKVPTGSFNCGNGRSPPSAESFYLTFADDSEQVHLTESYDGPCGSAALSNGQRTSQSTVQWLNAIQHDTARIVTPPTSTSSTSTPHGVTIQTEVGSGPISLAAAPYGFLVPQSWTLTPLASHGGPPSFATWVNPSAATEMLNYEVSGGELGQVYNHDRSVNLAGALHAYCTITASQRLSSNEETYTCAAPAGMETRGVIVVHPFPNGWSQVQVTLPADLDETVSDILNSVH